MSTLIYNRMIGINDKPFIIAEMSANHDQSIERALKIVDEVAESGADAIKLQTLRPEGITLDVKSEDFYISDKDNLWQGQTLYELYQKAHLPWEWHPTIFEYAKKRGLVAFSSPFDLKAVDFLESLEVPCYKIGSCENRDIPLIQKVASTGKPLFLSTGMANIVELSEAVEAAVHAGCKDLILLKCTCAYPADPAESNLRTLLHMRELFNCEVGISDHTKGMGVLLASIALGATVIEKHVTLAESDDTLDASFSVTPTQLKQIVTEADRAWKGLGKIMYGPSESEKRSLPYRRSIYISADMKKSEIFTEENIQSVRPSFGLHPKFYQFIIGKRAIRDLKKGEPLSWDMID